MRRLKRYLPPLFILLLIAAGAAMPWAVSWVQDARISSLQEKLELNAVNLTLRENASVGPALEVVSGGYTPIFWENQTRMTEEEAFSAAEEAIEQMRRHDLIPEAYLLAEEEGGWAEPFLAVAGDGSTALVWNCYWNSLHWAVSVDDASGKAVQFFVDSPEWLIKAESNAIQSAQEQWDQFLWEYYGEELEDVDGLRLDIYEDITVFNY